MDLKTKQLLAIAAAYGGNCERCVGYHIRQGIAAGLEEKDILIAIRIATKIKQASASFLDEAVTKGLKEMDKEGAKSEE